MDFRERFFSILRSIRNFFSLRCIGGHFGRDKTYDKIATRFYWPNLYNDVRQYVVACDSCQRVNEAGGFVKANVPLHPIKVDPEVWKMVCALMIYSLYFNLLNIHRLVLI